MGSRFANARSEARVQGPVGESVGFIGLGALGLPLAANLLGAGYPLRVYNRTASKADPLVAQGAHRADRPADAVVENGVVASLVWDGAALEEIVASEGFLERLGPNGVHVSLSTVSPETSRRMAARHAEHGSAYVEATVFGRPEAAVARELWMPIAGPQEAKDRVRPLLEAMGAKGVFDFGETIGASATVKLVGNFLIASATRSLRESLTIAQGEGVDPQTVVDMLTQTLFPAPIYRSYGKAIADGVDTIGGSRIPLKDVGLLRDVARRAGTPTPVADRLLEMLERQAEGG